MLQQATVWSQLGTRTLLKMYGRHLARPWWSGLPYGQHPHLGLRQTTERTTALTCSWTCQKSMFRKTKTSEVWSILRSGTWKQWGPLWQKQARSNQVDSQTDIKDEVLAPYGYCQLLGPICVTHGQTPEPSNEFVVNKEIFCLEYTASTSLCWQEKKSSYRVLS